jgi:hypothetical protein
MRPPAALHRSLALSFVAILQLVEAAKLAKAGSGASDLSGAHECAWAVGDDKYHPCALVERPDGRIDLKQAGKDSFDGTLTQAGNVFYLDGTYRSEGTEIRLTGDLERKGASLFGRVKDGNIPVSVEIRPPTEVKPAPPSQLDLAMKTMVDAASVAARVQLPLRVRYVDAPKLSFTVKSMDERAWERLHGIFTMVPEENNAGIKCVTAKLHCTLTSQAGADVDFYFASTADGPKLKKIELPAEGD